MGATESRYSKLGTRVTRLHTVPRKKIKQETETETDNNNGGSADKFKKRRRESLFASSQWSRRRGSDVSDWPAWYHGWCRKAQVEQQLAPGPDGLFLVKNSTEFPGDLTLCLYQAGSVHYFRVRRCEVGRNKVTLDNQDFFQDVESLIENYKKEQGNLPCKLGIACGRQLTESELREVLGEDKPQQRRLRRKGKVDPQEMLIINRES